MNLGRISSLGLFQFNWHLIQTADFGGWMQELSAPNVPGALLMEASKREQLDILSAHNLPSPHRQWTSRSDMQKDILFTQTWFEPKIFYLKKCLNYDKSNSPKNATKTAKLRHYSLSPTKQRNILERFYPRQDFFYTNIVGTLVCFCISAADGEQVGLKYMKIKLEVCGKCRVYTNSFLKEIGPAQGIVSLQWDLQWQKISENLKFSVWATNRFCYELIFPPHIVEDQIQLVCIKTQFNRFF